MKISIVTCMKNEGPFILEWIAYNRLIGVTDFQIYTNDCTDGTGELLDALEKSDLVTHRANPATPGKPYQMAALRHAGSLPEIRSANWVFVTDVDEFLDIRCGDGKIPDLISACGDPLAISITMRMMANGGIEHYKDQPVIGQFTWTHPPDLWNSNRAIEVKTLTRQDYPLKFFGAHRPFLSRGADHAQVTWTDGSGRAVPWAFKVAANKRRRHRFPATGARDLASLNHYTLRSLDSYLVKSDRGDVNRAYRSFRHKYWADRNEAVMQDHSILHWLPQLKAEITALMALPGVRAAHDTCVNQHRALISRLNADPAYQELREALRTERTHIPNDDSAEQCSGQDI